MSVVRVVVVAVAHGFRLGVSASVSTGPGGIRGTRGIRCHAI